MSVLSQIFNATQNVWILPGFVKNLFFEPNFQPQSTTQNFWILPNFIVGMSRVVKTLNFGLDFYCDWKFLNFTNFHLSHVLNGQKCQFWAKFLTRIKISSLAGQGGQTLDFKLNLQRDWKYLDFAKFHPSQVWSGQKSHFWAKFSKQLKISWFCQISTFACPEWSKLSILGLIFIAIENFWILPNFILRMSWWSKMSVLSQIFNTTQNFWILPNFILCRSFK